MKLAILASSIVALAGCASSNTGSQSTAVGAKPDVPGTVFTILFENEAAADVIKPANPNFWALAHQNGEATSYISTTHPSLPNYIMLTSGTTNGVNTDNDPRYNFVVPGTANLPDQLAYDLTAILVEERARFERLYASIPVHMSPLAYPIDPLLMPLDTGVPLHDGAHRYYAERGLLPDSH